jgi:hypothetical protein
MHYRLVLPVNFFASRKDFRWGQPILAAAAFPGGVWLRLRSPVLLQLNIFARCEDFVARPLRLPRPDSSGRLLPCSLLNVLAAALLLCGAPP